MEKKVLEVIQKPSVKNQYFATIVATILAMTMGLTAGWSSPMIPILTSDESPLPTGKIGMSEASWIASLTCAGGTIGNIIFGFVTNSFGRKWPLIFLSIPTIISWLLILFAQNVYYLYASRIVNGMVGGGIFVITPLFVREISHDSVRGILGTTIRLISNIGTLISFVMGSFCDYYAQPKLVIALVVLFVALFIFFPESPTFLVKQNRIREAEDSIRFYQDLRGKDKENILQEQINKLKTAIGKSDRSVKETFQWSDLLVNPGRKAFLIGIGLATLNQFCGAPAMLYYTSNIFQDAGSTISPNVSSIIVGAIQIFGCLVTASLIDRAGRRFLYVTSTIGTAIGLIVLGVYVMLKTWGYDVEAYNWIPIISFSFVVFIGSLAVLSLPFLIVSETMPEKLKNFGASFCFSLIWFNAFIAVKYLPLMIETLGFAYSMFSFASVCLVSAVLIILYLPETKGKSYEEIMEMLS